MKSWKLLVNLKEFENLALMWGNQVNNFFLSKTSKFKKCRNILYLQLFQFRLLDGVVLLIDFKNSGRIF